MITSSPGSYPPTTRQLDRSASDSMCCGVCGGIAEFLGIDSSLVRLAFVVGTLWGGIGLLLYIALAFILPVEQVDPAIAPEQAPRATLSPARGRHLGGVILVVFGALLLLGNLGFAPWLSWNLFWPAVLILLGVAVLVRGLPVDVTHKEASDAATGR